MFSSCYSLAELHLDNWSNANISKIITNLPADNSGVTRTIYCKESEAAGLTLPEGWVFSYIDEEPEQGGGTSGSGNKNPGKPSGSGGNYKPGKPSGGVSGGSGNGV
jgi:hypothetical protein